jgi:cysteinyl-tRNA synthetase
MKHKNLLSILALFLAFGATNIAKAQTINYREEMRQFVIGISDYARAAHPNFIVIPQNGMPLITSDGEPSSPVATNYANAIDGTGIESLFYGYPKGTRKTPIAVQQPMLALADVFKANGKTVMVTDYCNGKKAIDASFLNNNADGYISLATKVSLNRVPKYPVAPYNVNSDDITAMSEAKNFLYLINPEKFKTKEDLIAAINATDYDMLVIDLFFNDGTALTTDDLAQLKIKRND